VPIYDQLFLQAMAIWSFFYTVLNMVVALNHKNVLNMVSSPNTKQYWIRSHVNILFIYKKSWGYSCDRCCMGSGPHRGKCGVGFELWAK
jgi:hypothetical protein